MLELEEARRRILAALPLPSPETVPLPQAAGRILLEPVVCPRPLPLFDNSAMDGYAVRSADTRLARPTQPVSVKLAGRIAAGDPPAQPVGPGECVRLFTGSPLPPGADAVVMQEDTRPGPEPDRISLLEPVQPWENVRLAGEDVKQEALLAGRGARITPGLLGLLGATGITQVTAARQPQVTVLATGSELREPGEPLAPGQIYESNRAMLAALLDQCGARARILPIVPDGLEPIRLALEHALEHSDAVLTSGGVSVGEFDHVKTAFEQAGGRIEFWKVAVKPGKPFVWGVRDARLFFGLPGNPVSAFVTFLLLVRPALLKMQGATDLDLAAHPAVLAESLANPGDRRHFLRVHLDREGRVSSAGPQASHALGGLARANALLDLSPGQTWPSGSKVQVWRWD